MGFDQSSPLRRRSRVFTASEWLVAALTLLIVGLPVVAFAQQPPAQVSNTVRQTQYVFLVDDSGSMQANDTNRLAVFSVRAMLSMLDERDEVSVMLLNGPDKVPVAPLRSNREALYDSLKASERMASYNGQATPCISGFQKVSEVLDAARRPGVQQVFFFLTDGVCEGGEVDRAPWDKRIAKDDFDFYYLRFNERDSSPVLAALAGDQNIFRLTAKEPAGMIVPLAAALARSQGYASYIIPLEKVVPAFPGSERVRVLAAAPDDAGELELEVRRASGADAGLKVLEHGKFQFKGSDGRGSPKNADPYQYLFGTYSDAGESTSYKAKGGSARWKGVVVPEYRLGVVIEIHEGKCASNGPQVQSLGSGKDACFRVRVYDGAGKEVTDGLRRMGAIVKLAWAVDDKLETTPRSPSSNTAWTFEQPSLRDAKYTLRPLLYITGREDIPPLRGVELTFTVASQNVVVEPAVLDVGELKLGTVAERKSFKLNGNFEAGRVKFGVDPKRLPPACVKIRVADQDITTTQSTVQTAAVGKEFPVDVSIPSWCGDQPLGRVEFPILMQFEASGGKTPEARSVLVAVEPKGGIDLPSDLHIEVKGGETGYTLGGDGARFMLKPHDAAKALQLRLELVPNSGAWSEEHLDAAFATALGDGFVKKDGAYERSVAVDVPVGGIDLPLAAISGTCCKGGDYVTTVRVYPEGGSGDPKTAFHDLHVKVHVVDAGTWACYGETFKKFAWLVLGLAAVAFLINLKLSTKLLPKPQRIAERLFSLEVTSKAGKCEHSPHPLLFNSKLSFRNRAHAWWRANPIKIGLPTALGGGTYIETLFIDSAYITKSPNEVITNATLLSKRDLPGMVGRTDGRGIDNGVFIYADNEELSVAVRFNSKTSGLKVSDGSQPLDGPPQTSAPELEDVRYAILNSGEDIRMKKNPAVNTNTGLKFE